MISPNCPKCKFRVVSGNTCPMCGTPLNTSVTEHKLDGHIYDVHYGQRAKPRVDYLKEKKNLGPIILLGMVTIFIILVIIFIIISI